MARRSIRRSLFCRRRFILPRLGGGVCGAGAACSDCASVAMVNKLSSSDKMQFNSCPHRYPGSASSWFFGDTDTIFIGPLLCFSTNEAKLTLHCRKAIAGFRQNQRITHDHTNSIRVPASVSHQIPAAVPRAKVDWSVSSTSRSTCPIWRPIRRIDASGTHI